MSRRDCGTSRVHAVTTGLMFVLSGTVMIGVLRGWRVVEQYWAFWPVVFVLPAIGRLAAPPAERSLFAGVGWLALAAGLVLSNLGYLEVRVRELVPLLLVVLGARLLYRARTAPKGTR